MINKTNEIYYLCAGPGAWGLDISIFKKLSGHIFGIINDKLFVWPKKLSIKSCNPKNIHNLLKVSEKNKDIVIIDRIKSKIPKVNICGHVNRSGENYLIGMTPYNNYPQFPDMTHIYKTHSHKRTKTVHTVGPKRYKETELNSKIIWSEAIGLVAPVFYYFDCNIKGVGLNRDSFLKQYLR